MEALLKVDRDFWQNRYAGRTRRAEGNGSRTHLMVWKAHYVNTLLVRAGLTSVVDIGCGTGIISELLCATHYLGVDIARAAIEIANERHGKDKARVFRDYHPGQFSVGYAWPVADVSLSLDVAYHITSEEVYRRYLGDLVNASRSFVVYYGPDKTAEELGTDPAPHVIYRRTATDLSGMGLRLLDVTANPYPVSEFGPADGSYSNFYTFENPRQ